MSDDRLTVLLNGYRDGTLSDEDRAELERQLLSSASAREQFWSHARMHNLLARWGQEEWGRRLVDEPPRPTAAPVIESPGATLIDDAEEVLRSDDIAGEMNESSDVVSLPLTASPEAGSYGTRLDVFRRRAFRLIVWGSVAACLVVAVWLGTLIVRHNQPPQIIIAPPPAPSTLPAGVAILSSSAQGVWHQTGRSLEAGEVIEAGLLKLASGAIRIDFYSGARVVLEGPAELELRSENEAFCHSGKLTAYVPEPARGFRVGAPGLNVVDLGTEFGLDVSKSRPVEVHVFTGEVEVKPSAAPISIKLTAGQGARVADGGLAPMPADRTQFLAEADLNRLASRSLELRYARWNEAAIKLASDPGMIVYYRPGGRSGDHRDVQNLAQGSKLAARPAQIVGCASAEGRWPNTQSLVFTGRGDRLRLDVPGNFTAITLLAWVRIDALPSINHGLLIPDGTAEGTPRWEIDNFGRLRLGIARNLGRAEADWEVVISTPAVTPDKLGRWTLLATTFDGKLVHHYCDGELVKTGAAQCPSPLRFGPAEFGNWRGSSDRHLNGRLDELAIFRRALDAQEIRSLYSMGRPDGPPSKNRKPLIE